MKKQNRVQPLPPEFAIANGLMIGPCPEELECLNEVELALVSLARVDNHVFALYGGCHKQMTGWHSMYVKDVKNVSRPVYWCANHLGEQDSLSDLDESE